MKQSVTVHGLSVTPRRVAGDHRRWAGTDNPGELVRFRLFYEGYARYLGSPGGVAEEIVGQALRDRRDKAIVATIRSGPRVMK